MDGYHQDIPLAVKKTFILFYQLIIIDSMMLRVPKKQHNFHPVR